MPASVDSFFDDYARLYTAGDVKGVTNLWSLPVRCNPARRGRSTCLTAAPCGITSLRPSLHIAARRTLRTWKPVEIDSRHLGEHSVFATVPGMRLDADGQVIRDTWSSYQLLATSDGWRLLSYTNHF